MGMADQRVNRSAFPLEPQPPRHDHPLEKFEDPLGQQRQDDRRNDPLQNQYYIVETDPGQDRLAVTAGSDQRPQGGRADVDDR